MKIKIAFCFLLSAFCFFPLLAQTGTLTVSSSNNQRFWLFIDDVQQNESSIPSIKITGMKTQNYRIRVEMDNAAENSVGQIISISNQQYGESYVVSFRNEGYVLSKSPSNVRVAQTQTLVLPPTANTYNPRQGRHGGGSSWGGNSSGGGHTQEVKPDICRNAQEFAHALQAINKESFEAGRLQTAKDFTSKGSICVEQIIQICNTFSFEASKLEYAKYAYTYCNDKNVYYLVKEVFQFQASKDELSKYIK